MINSNKPISLNEEQTLKENTSSTLDACNPDLTNPSINILDPNPVYIQASKSENYIDNGATCTDACDGAISENVEVSGEVVNLSHIKPNATEPNPYLITYNCKDSAANEAGTEARKANVYACDEYDDNQVVDENGNTQCNQICEFGDTIEGGDCDGFCGEGEENSIDCHSQEPFDTVGCEIDNPEDLEHEWVPDTFFVNDTHTTQDGFGMEFLPFHWSGGSMFSGGEAYLNHGNGTNQNGDPLVDPENNDIELWLNNINAEIDFPIEDYQAYTGLQIDAGYGGGNVNLEINGDLRNVGHMLDLHNDIVGNVRVTLGGIADTGDAGTITLCPMVAGMQFDSIIIGGQELAIDNFTCVECEQVPVTVTINPPPNIDFPNDTTTITPWSFTIDSGDWSWGGWPPPSGNMLRPHYSDWSGRLLAGEYKFELENNFDFPLTWKIDYTNDVGAGSPVGGSSSGSVPVGTTGGGTIVIGEAAVCCVSDSPLIAAGCYEDMSKLLCEDIHFGTHYAEYKTCEEAFADDTNAFSCPADGGCLDDKIDWEDQPDSTATSYNADEDADRNFTADGVDIDIEVLPGFEAPPGTGNYITVDGCDLGLEGTIDMSHSATVFDFMFEEDNLPLEYLHVYAGGSGPFYAKVNGWSIQVNELTDFAPIGGSSHINDVSIEVYEAITLTGEIIPKAYHILFGDLSGTITDFEFGGAQLCMGDICYKDQDGDGGGHVGECAPATYEEAVFASHPHFGASTSHASGSFEIEAFYLALPDGGIASGHIGVQNNTPEYAVDDIDDAADLNETQLHNINARYTPDTSEALAGIEMDIGYYGGVFNVDLPGVDAVIVGNTIEAFKLLDGQITDGVEITVSLTDTAAESGVYGTITWCPQEEGEKVEWAQLGGQELWVDNPRCVPCEGDTTIPGDTNDDGTLNILDIIITINYILGVAVPDDTEVTIADVNEDDLLNILDIVRLVNLILDDDGDKADDDFLS